MADADITITGGKVDTRTVGAATDEHRQVVVLGSPTTAANVVEVGPEGNLFVVPRGGTRANVGQYYEDAALTAADVLLTPTGRSIAYAAPATGQYVVSAGKTFRLQQMQVSITAASTTAAAVRVRLRVNPAGAVALGSPIQASWRIGSLSVGTQAANYTHPTEIYPFPEGMEFPAGTGIGVSAFSTTAASHTLDISLLGYEY